MEIREMKSENVWDYENSFYWFSEPSRLLKALAHFELYKTITGLPGDFLELGVYKGASLVRFCTFRHLLEAEGSRKIIGFDAFGKFPSSPENVASDVAFIERFEQSGGQGLSLDEMKQIMRLKQFENVSLIMGDVFQTLPMWLEENRSTRLSAVHFDMDVFAPTQFALNLLWSRMVKGGLFIFDDFGLVEGATLAVEEFVRDKDLLIQKLPNYKTPSFIVVP